MAYGYWQAGIHFQAERLVCVALQKTRWGWALRRWWQLPVGRETPESEIIAALRKIKNELPRYHRVNVAFPAMDTLKKQLPFPRMVLRESEQIRWIATTVTQQLEMPEEAIAFDYCATDTNIYSVTAARQRDVALLQKRISDAGLELQAIVPDASALHYFFPWLAKEDPGLMWHNGEQWLWASRTDWGVNDEPPPALLRCTTEYHAGHTFNPWFPLSQLQPPLPEQGDNFAIALALALGGH